MFFDKSKWLEQSCNRITNGTFFCKIIWKSVQWFLTRRFLKFSIQIYSENKPRPLAAMFFDKSKWLEQSWYRITKGPFLQNYMYICWPCFLTNPNGLNNIATGSPKEHFCKIILKSVCWFRTRRFLKFSI